ncbi:7SK snRNA methylphosphate capping enzyme-like isoform X1 [Euwallacea similis]|uniref:7SK snRNA methylphosphate capping enzyme-like isoform X1 n=1 Tax=Euwallacea similis TaxID=1736056 RepID=UPI00345088CA
MSSPKMDTLSVSKPDPKPINNNRNQGNKSQNASKKRFKHDRSSRKRSKSFSGCGPINSKPVLPTKFLLGGNINDPLNLNSLQNEDINRAMNAVTPKSSPLPTPPRRKMPIEVIVSPNTHDPLHLMDCENDKEYEEHLNSPIKKARKKRLNKKRRTLSGSAEGSVPNPTGNSEACTPEATVDSAKIPEDPEIFKNVSTKTVRNLCFDLSDDKKDKTKRRSEDSSVNHAVKKFKNSMDKIVSPVVPQPGAWLKRSNSIKLPRPRQNKVSDKTLPVFKEENKRFQYGNYNRYYGYRNPTNETDHRLKVFSHYPYLFENKDILDIGCNIGHITLSIARDFKARTVTGIDIDPTLISIARKNVRHYVKTVDNTLQKSETTPDYKSSTNKSSSEFFPLSLPILYGPIDVPGFHDSYPGREFPKNVIFKQCNYVIEDEASLALEQPQFDVIMCLSVTKWIHLNWGDNGLKLSFRRMYEQLRPGGKLILEPQHWGSYKRKKNLTEIIYRNYKSIDFFPDKFREYLLSPAVGFAKSEMLGYPQHKSTAFRRPIQIFTKSTMFPSERIDATPSSQTQQSGSSKHESQIHIQVNRLGQHVYTNLIRSTPRYGSSSEEHVADSGLSPCLSDDKVTPKSEFTPTYSPESETLNKTVVYPLESATSDNSCGAEDHGNSSQESKVRQVITGSSVLCGSGNTDKNMTTKTLV